MPIAPAILHTFPELNDAQREAIGHTDGPLLVIAGPGSGKTFVLVLRTLNLLLQGLAQPRDILLCTFTEKAAFELRDRLSLYAKKVGYTGAFSELLIGTIHGICNDFILRYRHRNTLGNSYEVLDELTQALFIFEHFDTIIGPEENEQYLHRWHTRWTSIEGARNYFNKITEELIDPAELTQSQNPFLQAIGQSYIAYVKMLFEKNRIDFAHQQKLFLSLLDDSDIGDTISNRVRYILVDEYQDTNHIQERLLLRLAAPTQNICVVGDEDQALYRFRGGTVRNILEFPEHFETCHTVNLATNYRSHRDIVAAYDRFMTNWDWANPEGRSFRYNKTILPDPDGTYPDYPAVFAIWGQTKQDEARRFADLIAFLKDNRVIEDYSQVALLLHSVRLDHSQPYLDALNAHGIPAFCPRARAFFDNEEIQLMIGCFAILLGYYGSGRGNTQGKALQQLSAYADACIVALGKRCAAPHPLATNLQRFTQEIASLKAGETLDRRLADYFYQDCSTKAASTNTKIPTSLFPKGTFRS